MIDAVSRDETIPKSFLAKIFQDLAKAGLLRSQRGAGGGFVLARPADQITVLEVIEAIDGRIALQRCLGEEPECDKMEGCALCSLFVEAQDRLKEVFARTSMADLARQQAAKAGLRPGGASPAACPASTDGLADRATESRTTAPSEIPTPGVNGNGNGNNNGNNNGHRNGLLNLAAASRLVFPGAPAMSQAKAASPEAPALETSDMSGPAEPGSEPAPVRVDA